MEGWPNLALREIPPFPLKHPMTTSQVGKSPFPPAACGSAYSLEFLYGFQNFSKCFFLTINKTISNTEEY